MLVAAASTAANMLAAECSPKAAECSPKAAEKCYRTTAPALAAAWALQRKYWSRQQQKYLPKPPT